MPRWALANVTPPCLCLLLQLLLLSLLSPSSHAQNMSGYFHVIGPMGDGWEPREKGNAEYVAKTTVFYDGNQERPVTLSNYLLIYGGSGTSTPALNDGQLHSTTRSMLPLPILSSTLSLCPLLCC